MIRLSKNYLDMSDKITHKGDEGSPVVFATLADLALAAAARRKEKDAKAKERSSTEE